MPTLVLLRHGQSTWNLENRFTGWTDVDLTPQGHAEAHAAANPRAKHGKHEYELEEFGLSEERVRERFRAYRERFPDARE